MKKTKIIALVMVIAIMVMGVGYAAWDDVTKLDANIATGTLKVNITGSYIQRTMANTTPTILDDGDDEVTFSVVNLYPTDYDPTKSYTDNENNSKSGAFEFRAINNGSIPVKLDSIDFIKNNPNSPLWTHLKVKGHVFFGSQISGPNPYGSHSKITMEDFIEKLINDVNTKDIVLEPGDTMAFGSIIYYLDSDTAENNTQNRNISFKLKFNWEQANL